MPIPPLRLPTKKAAVSLPASKAAAQDTPPKKPLSNKEIAMLLFVSHAEGSLSRVTDEQMAVVSGVANLRGARPEKIKACYVQLVDRYCTAARKLLTKRGLAGRITIFGAGD